MSPTCRVVRCLSDHCKIGTKSRGSLNNFRSLEGLSKLSAPIIDCSLLSIRISYEDERPLHLVNLEGYLTASLQVLYITDVLPEDVRTLSTRYLQYLATFNAILFVLELLTYWRSPLMIYLLQ